MLCRCSRWRRAWRELNLRGEMLAHHEISFCTSLRTMYVTWMTPCCRQRCSTSKARELTWIASMSSVLSSTSNTADVTLPTNSGSISLPRPRNNALPNCIASAGMCTVSSVVGVAIASANFGHRCNTSARQTWGEVVERDSTISSTMAVATGSDISSWTCRHFDD